MRIHYYSDRVTDLIGAVLFPSNHKTVRRRNLRFFAVSVVLGMGFCVAFAAILLILNRQGRI